MRRFVKLGSVLIAVLIVSVTVSLNRQEFVNSSWMAGNATAKVQKKALTPHSANRHSGTNSMSAGATLHEFIQIENTGKVNEFKSDSKIIQLPESSVEDELRLSEADTGSTGKSKKFYAFWNSVNVPENELKQLMNAGITRSPNYKDLEKVVKTGRKVIPLFGAFREDQSDRELRQRVGWYKDVFERVGWENIECIILRDEPYLKSLTIHQMEVILNEAKKQYEAPLAFTFTVNSIMNRPLPKGMDIVFVNYYPFFKEDAPAGYAQIHDYVTFKNKLDRLIRLIRQKSPGSAIAVTAQVFGSESGIPWRMPEPETAQWYVKAIEEHDDVVGLTFWGWESNRYNGLSSNRKLQLAWLNALKN